MSFLYSFLLIQNVLAESPPQSGNSLWDFLEPVETVSQQNVSQPLPTTTSDATSSDDSFEFISPQASLINFYQDPLNTLGKDPLDLTQIDPKDFDIPIDINDDVIRWMKYFHNGSCWTPLASKTG